MADVGSCRDGSFVVTVGRFLGIGCLYLGHGLLDSFFFVFFGP